MKTKALSVFFAVAFVFILLAPFLFTKFSGWEVSEWEHRVLAWFPSPRRAIDDPKAFIEEFDAWFSDHVGFREKSAGFYRKLMHLTKSVHFQEGSYIVLIGKDGYCYSGGAISDFGESGNQSGLFLSEGELQSLAQRLLAVKRYLDERGIPLIVVFCARKEDIYPEYYPKSIMRRPEPAQLDVVTEFVKSHTYIDMFNTKECLLQAKASYQVFDKDGNQSMLTHYNEIGAFFAYQELMKHIQIYMPEIKAFSLEDVEITYADLGIHRNIPDVCLKQDTTFSRLGGDVFDAVPLLVLNSGVAFENNDVSLPTILLMRDSYAGNGSTYWCKYLPQHFGRTIMIHHRNTENLDSYVTYFKPDIVVFELSKGQLKGFSDYVAGSHDMEQF